MRRLIRPGYSGSTNRETLIEQFNMAAQNDPMAFAFQVITNDGSVTMGKFVRDNGNWLLAQVVQNYGKKIEPQYKGLGKP